MSDFVIKKINLDELIPYEKNPRKNKNAIEKVASSIKQFGFKQPIVIDKKNNIIVGHTRFEAAKKLGLKEVPCVIADDLNDAKIKAYRIVDNKTSEYAEWDIDLLDQELSELSDMSFDMSDRGFDSDEINEKDGLEELNQEEILKQESKVNLGEVWILGDHRLMCGDSTEKEKVINFIGDSKPVLMVTDPPYGVNYDPAWREGCDLGVGKRSKGKVLNDDLIDWSNSYELFTGNAAYIWHAGKYTHLVAQSIEKVGFELISQIIWAKQHFVLSRGDYHWKHEPCWYAARKGCNHNWQGKRDQATVWDIKNNNSFGNREAEETVGHGTQKPIDCMLIPILNNSKKDDFIYDPFGGSGTTLIACEKTNRKCLMIELDKNYCDVIIQRWQKTTGKKATRECDGVLYDDLIGQ